MRKTIAILFATMILLSSGFAQAVLHVCPQDGVSISEESCNMHETSSCCDEKNNHVAKEQSECCADTYFFAVSPKFGSVKDLSFSDLGFQIVHYQIIESFELGLQSELPKSISFDKPPSTGRDILTKINCLTI